MLAKIVSCADWKLNQLRECGMILKVKESIYGILSIFIIENMEILTASIMNQGKGIEYGWWWEKRGETTTLKYGKYTIQLQPTLNITKVKTHKSNKHMLIIVENMKESHHHNTTHRIFSNTPSTFLFLWLINKHSEWSIYITTGQQMVITFQYHTLHRSFRVYLDQANSLHPRTCPIFCRISSMQITQSNFSIVNL